MRIVVLTCLLLLFGISPLRSDDFWQQVKGIEGGVVRSLLFTPESELLAAFAAGIYRATPFTGWRSSSDKIPDKDFRALALGEYRTIYALSSSSVVYRSSDGGVTWLPVGRHGNGGTPHSLAVSPRHKLYIAKDYDGIFCYDQNASDPGWLRVTPDTLSLEIRAILAPDEDIVCAATSSGLLRSKDKGATWHFAAEDLTELAVSSLAVDSAGRILAGLDIGLLYESRDGGAHWRQIGNPPETSIANIAFLRDNSIVVSAGTSLYVSSDNGATWTQHLREVLGGSIRSLAVDANDVIFAGTAGDGVYRLSPDRRSWSRFNSRLSLPNVRSLAADSTGTLYAAVLEGGIFRSIDDGRSWQAGGDRAGLRSVRALSADAAGNVYAAADNGTGIYRSSDQGLNWIHKDFPDAGGVSVIASMADKSTIAAFARKGLMRSIDAGESWQDMNWPGVDGRDIADISLDAAGNVYVAAGRDGLRYSGNKGADWRVLSPDVYALRVVSTGQGRLWLADFNNLYVSSDNGESWRQDLSANVSQARIQAFAPGPNGDMYIANNKDGVLLQRGGEALWRLMTSGMSSFNVQTLMLAPGGVLYAGSNAGFYRSSKPLLLPSSIDPAAGSTSINITIAGRELELPCTKALASSRITIAVYTITGALLEERSMESGSKSMNLLPSHAQKSGGLYILRLRAGACVQVRKWLLQ